MPPTTTFVLDADESKAVNAILNLVRQQKKVDSGWKSTKSVAKEAGQSMLNSLTSIGAGFVSLGAAVNLVKGYLDELSNSFRESARVADEFLRIGIDAQVLLGKPGAEYRKEILGMALKYNIPANEIQPALANFVSSTPALSQQQRDALFEEIAEFRKQSSLTLDQLVPSFTALSNIAPEFVSGKRDANWAQSVFKQALDQSKARPEELELNLPRVIAAGANTGLTTEQAVGLWAYITTKSGSATQATEGFVGMTEKIAFPAGVKLDEPDSTIAPVGRGGRKKKGAESTETLQRRILGLAGIDESVGGYERYDRLAAAYQSGKITDELIKGVTGSGSDFTAITNLLKGWDTAQQSVATMYRMTAPGMDPTKESLRKLQADPLYQAREYSVASEIRLEEDRISKAVTGFQVQQVKSEIQREMESPSGFWGHLRNLAMQAEQMIYGDETIRATLGENAEAINNAGNVAANRAAMGMSAELPRPMRVNTQSLSGALRLAAEAINQAVGAAEAGENRSGRSSREAARRTHR